MRRVRLFLPGLMPLMVGHVVAHTQALSISRALFALVGSVNRRTLDPLSGRIFFLYALAHEKQGRLGDVRRYAWGPSATRLTMSRIVGGGGARCAALVAGDAQRSGSVPPAARFGSLDWSNTLTHTSLLAWCAVLGRVFAGICSRPTARRA